MYISCIIIMMEDFLSDKGEFVYLYKYVCFIFIFNIKSYKNILHKIARFLFLQLKKYKKFLWILSDC